MFAKRQIIQTSSGTNDSIESYTLAQSGVTIGKCHRFACAAETEQCELCCRLLERTVWLTRARASVSVCVRAHGFAYARGGASTNTCNVLFNDRLSVTYEEARQKLANTE